MIRSAAHPEERVKINIFRTLQLDAELAKNPCPRPPSDHCPQCTLRNRMEMTGAPGSASTRCDEKLICSCSHSVVNQARLGLHAPQVRYVTHLFQEPDKIHHKYHQSPLVSQQSGRTKQRAASIRKAHRTAKTGAGMWQ